MKFTLSADVGRSQISISQPPYFGKAESISFVIPCWHAHVTCAPGSLAVGLVQRTEGVALEDGVQVVGTPGQPGDLVVGATRVDEHDRRPAGRPRSSVPSEPIQEKKNFLEECIMLPKNKKVSESFRMPRNEAGLDRGVHVVVVRLLLQSTLDYLGEVAPEHGLVVVPLGGGGVGIDGRVEALWQVHGHFEVADDDRLSFMQMGIGSCTWAA